jgi:tetratricopeptide (TPR) repeat protein
MGLGKENLFRIRTELLIALSIVVLTLTAYWQVGGYGFAILDDNIYVYENRYVVSGFTFEGLIWAFRLEDPIYLTYWHPLTWLSHMLDCQLFGTDAGMHHRTNLFFHMANSLLLFLVLKRMTRTLWKSAFVAALFALHPIHVESVVWIAERKNILSTFFWMLSLITYARYANKPDRIQYFTVILIYMLGLMAKPTLVTLPFVFLLMDYWPLGRIQRDRSGVIDVQNGKKPMISGFDPSLILRLVSEKIPFFILSGISVYFSSVSARAHGTFVSYEAVPMSLRIGNALVSYVTYLVKMIWPLNLAVFYPFPESVPVWQSVCALLILTGITIAGFRMLDRAPFFIVGWMWYIGTLIPVIGIVQAGLWPAVADRFVYIPFVGLFIMAVWGVPELSNHQRYRKTVLGLLTTAVLLFLIPRTYFQTRVWENNTALYEHALEVIGDNDIIHNNLGVVLARDGRTEEAIQHHLAALKLNPEDASIHNNLGNAFARQGNTDQAIRYYTEALRIEPDHAKAHINLGNVLASTGATDKALGHFLTALHLNPNNKEAHYNLGIVLFNQGMVDEAIDHYFNALQINPEYAEAHNNLGVALGTLGRMSEAISHFRSAIRIDPGFAEASENLQKMKATQSRIDGDIANTQKALASERNNASLNYRMGDLYRSKKNLMLAIDHYQRALALNPGFAEALTGLGIALAMQGNYEQALAVLKKAITHRPNHAEAYYYIAAIYARQNQGEKSIKWLQKALLRGYSDWDRIKTDRNLANIRHTSFYKTIMQNHR